MTALIPSQSPLTNKTFPVLKLQIKEIITPMYPKIPRPRLDDSPVVAYDFNMKSPKTSKSESIPILKRLI